MDGHASLIVDWTGEHGAVLAAMLRGLGRSSLCTDDITRAMALATRIRTHASTAVPLPPVFLDDTRRRPATADLAARVGALGFPVVRLSAPPRCSSTRSADLAGLRAATADALDGPVPFAATLPTPLRTAQLSRLLAQLADRANLPTPPTVHDRRAAPRLAADTPVVLTLAGAEIPCLVIDVSPTGAALLPQLPAGSWSTLRASLGPTPRGLRATLTPAPLDHPLWRLLTGAAPTPTLVQITAVRLHGTGSQPLITVTRVSAQQTDDARAA